VTPDPTERLRHYESLKFELAEVLRELACVVPPGQTATRNQLTDLLARLAEDRFNLVFVGRFNRGKTSLMNALLGSPWLPTGIVPLTSVITSVTYGSTEKVQIEFDKGPFRYDIPTAALPDYITEKGNPGNVRRIRQAHISLPAELLRRGFHFVDTPGLGSAIIENTRTTEGFYPEADAIACVTAYDAPLSAEETQALQIFARAHVPTLLILNKQDTVSGTEREEIASYVRRQLSCLLPEAMPPILSVSATTALSAKFSGDGAALAESGLPELENVLVQILATDKGSAVIAGVRERAIALVDQLNSAGAQSFRERLRKISARSSSDFDDRAAVLPLTSLQRMTGCAICEHVGNGLYDFLRQYQHELADSPLARGRFAAAGGLCPRHTWLYASMSHDRDICLALTPLVKRISTELGGIQKGRNEAHPTQGGSPTQHSLGSACALCALQAQLESTALRALAERLCEPGGDSSENFPGICLPHLQKVRVGSAQFTPDARREVGIQALERRLAATAERLAEDMQRYVLRRDAIRHGLASEEEIQAAKRVLGFLAGSRAFPPQPGDP
jgi:GTP-binding protein EngB required for normal cell division